MEWCDEPSGPVGGSVVKLLVLFLHQLIPHLLFQVAGVGVLHSVDLFMFVALHAFLNLLLFYLLYINRDHDYYYYYYY